MIKLSYILILLFFVAPNNLLPGQERVFLDSAQIREFLKNPELNQVVKDFWQGRPEVSDNDGTLELLKVITSENKRFFPVCFSTLNEIVKVADGALAEIMPMFCFEMIINYPAQTLNYFSANHDMRARYARFLGYEFYFKEKGTSDLKMNFAEFQRFLKNHPETQSKTLHIAYHDFIREIKDHIKEMN